MLKKLRKESQLEVFKTIQIQGRRRMIDLTPETFDHRMLRNYPKGTNRTKINTFLVATAYNMKKGMRMKEKIFLTSFQVGFCRLLTGPKK